MAYYIPTSSSKGLTLNREGRRFLNNSGFYKVTYITGICVKRGYIVVITIIILLFLSLQAPAQQQPSTSVIIGRINSLEQENQRLKEDVADVKSENDELEASLKEYEPLFKFWDLIIGAFGAGNFLGFAWLYFRVIPRKINEKVVEIIKQSLTDRRADFLGLLKEYDFEKSVKERHRIVLLSHRNGSDDYHYRMLTKNGFKVKALTSLEQLHDAEFNAEDILVINNDGNHWPVEQVQTFINSQTNYCFYFGKGVIIPEPNRMDRFAAANFRTQFIGNLMNLLKYSHHQN